MEKDPKAKGLFGGTYEFKDENNLEWKDGDEFHYKGAYYKIVTDPEIEDDICIFDAYVIA